jgi:SOS-response transcriptional repressor LexA
MTTTILRPLTTRQRAIWRYIRDYHAEHRHGCCVRDLCRRFRMASPNGGASAVEVLIRKGWVEWPKLRSAAYRMPHCILPSRESLEADDAETT